MKILGLAVFLLAMGGIAWGDGRRVKREEGKRERMVYLAVLGMVTVAGALLFLGVRLPSPLEPIEKYIPSLSVLTGE